MSPWKHFKPGRREKKKVHIYSMYVKDQRSYQPKAMEGDAYTCSVAICKVVDTVFTGVTNRYYYVCCRDGKYVENKKPRITNGKRPNQHQTRKLNGTCTSRMYVNEFKDGHVEVTYIKGHTGHELGGCELPHCLYQPA